MNLKRTPLYPSHEQLGGRLIEFGGWNMPVQYSSIVEEHLAVRRAAGLFDVSHMGKFFVRGAGAEAFLSGALTNDPRKLAPGQAHYTLLCNERGGVIDDLYAYRLGPAEFMLIVNASRMEADWACMQARAQTAAHVTLENQSPSLGIIAVQGPKAVEFVPKVLSGSIADLKKNQVATVSFRSSCVYVARTGYTGEDGFELVAPNDELAPLWQQLLDAGKDFGLKPAGLGARDTLRTEMCYPLYGHELDEETTPLEAGVSWAVALDKPFIGKDALVAQKTGGLTKKLVAFRMTGKSAPPRPHYPVWTSGGGTRLGEVTSGTQSPSLNAGIGLAYVPPASAAAGTAIEIEIRGQRYPAVIVPKPIYRKEA